MAGGETGLGAEVSTHRGFTEGCPTAIQSLCLSAREERSNSAQSFLSDLTGKRSFEAQGGLSSQLISVLSPGLRSDTTNGATLTPSAADVQVGCTQGG